MGSVHTVWTEFTEARLKTAASVRTGVPQAQHNYAAMSAEELSKRRWAVLTNEAKLAQARAQLTLLKAGAWKPDLDIAKTQVGAAETQVKQTETDLERLTVRALVSGQIL